MVNELPLNYFSVLTVVDFIIIAISLRNMEKPNKTSLITSVFSAFLSFILANMILNGNVVLVQSDGSVYSYIPIQSQPINYIFLGLGVIMSATSVAYTYLIINNYIESKKEFSALGDWVK